MLDHFGWVAPFYDRAIPVRHAEILANLAELPAQGWLLDAGGGTGRIAAALRHHVSQVMVVDLSAKMLSQAALKGGLHLACSHTERLPFPDATFERIIMVDALHHVCDHTQTASELWRVLKSGGTIVVEEPDIRRMSAKLVALAEKVILMRSHFLTPLKISELFPDDGSKKRIEQEGFNAWVIIEKL